MNYEWNTSLKQCHIHSEYRFAIRLETGRSIKLTCGQAEHYIFGMSQKYPTTLSKPNSRPTVQYMDIGFDVAVGNLHPMNMLRSGVYMDSCPREKNHVFSSDPCAPLEPVLVLVERGDEVKSLGRSIALASLY